MRSLLILGLSLICLLCGCDKSDDIIIDETHGVPYQLGDLYIDEYGNEGIVCRTQDKYRHKMIMVVSSDEGYASWGPLDQQVSPYDTLKAHYSSRYFEYYGIAILQCAKSYGIEKFPALKWCNDKNHGEKYPKGTSWHLPTDDELACINVIFGDDESVDLNNKYYWTCIEDISGCSDYGISNDNFLPKDRAMPLNLNGETLGNKDLWVKRNKYYVRAVKYIYYEKR